MNEYTWLHGEPSRDWFVAAHGVFLLALIESCVQMVGHELRLFPLGLENIPWDSISFDKFRTERALLVSCCHQKKKSGTVKIENDGMGVQSFDLFYGNNLISNIVLEPGRVFEQNTDLSEMLCRN